MTRNSSRMQYLELMELMAIHYLIAEAMPCPTHTAAIDSKFSLHRAWAGNVVGPTPLSA